MAPQAQHCPSATKLEPVREPLSERHYRLPCKIYFLATCGFTLAPFRFGDRVIWIGNTHLHPYNPADRARQAMCIAREIAKLGDVPILFLGDFNTVPPGCRETGFPAGEPDVNSYRNDRSFQILLEAGLRMRDHDDADNFYTYPTGLPNRTLDYILHNDHWEVQSYEVLKEFTDGSFPGISEWQHYHDTGVPPADVVALLEKNREEAADS